MVFHLRILSLSNRKRSGGTTSARRLRLEGLECRTLLSTSATVNTALGESYFVFEDWGTGTYEEWAFENAAIDAEKSSSNPNDDLLCWAAAASNVLAWGGWGAEGFHTCDEIFGHIQDHTPDTGGVPLYAWEWWLNGGPIGTMDGEGGAYFDTYDYDRWKSSRLANNEALDNVYRLFQTGYGIALRLAGPGGHAVTCWGINYDPNTGEYLGIWITDSDDSKGSENPPNRLRYYEVELSGSRWYLQNYYGSNSWYIDRIWGLMGNPATLTPDPSAVISGSVFADSGGDGARDTSEDGLSDISVFLDVNGNGQRDEFLSESFSSNEPVALSGKTYLVSTLQVTTDSEFTFISDLTVTLDITHAYNGALTGWLVAPNGTQVCLFSGVGGSGENFVDVTFADDAANSARDFPTGTVSGTLQPYYNLSRFEGLNPNGEWQLKIYDGYYPAPGTLNNWSLTITQDQEPLTTTDENGYFAFEGLPGGEYTVIATGRNISRTVTLAAHEAAFIEIGAKNQRLPDLNGDGRVDAQDLNLLRTLWGRQDPLADVNGDGRVDSTDLDLLRAFWGSYAEGAPDNDV